MKFINQLAVFSLLLFLAIGLTVSCKKDDPAKPAAPVASFTYSADNKTVKFTSTSTNSPTETNWDFGDGKTGSGDTITHIYDSAGNYTATLTVKNAGGSNSTSQMITVLVKEQIIEIKTSFGTMIMWLYNETPQHKANFLKLASENFFDDITFHRIVKDFVIQGGDPLSKDDDPNNDGTGGPGYTIPAEIKSTLKHNYGAVGAARTNNPAKASSGSQFYIVVNKAGTHSLDGSYTVFGQIIKGMEVAMEIAVQDKDAADRPIDDIKMDVNILQKTKAEILTDYGYEVK